MSRCPFAVWRTGASIAVVQGGDVVYLNGFGVQNFGSTQPVTPDTMMMIGSVTKSMTTMLAGTLVDDGRLTWDTRSSTCCRTSRWVIRS